MIDHGKPLLLLMFHVLSDMHVTTVTAPQTYKVGDTHSV